MLNSLDLHLRLGLVSKKLVDVIEIVEEEESYLESLSLPTHNEKSLKT